MGIFSQGLGRQLRRADVSLKAAGVETASTTGAGVELGDVATVNLELVITAASGTVPTLDVTIEGSNDATNWYTLGTFAQKTGVATERKAFPAAQHVRSRSTITGTTPSFTYSVTGTGA